MSIEREAIDQNIAALDEKITEKQDEIDEKQKELDNFDISSYMDENDYKVQHEDETVEVMGQTFKALDILEEMDYTAFREGFNNWIGSLDVEDHEEYKVIEEELEELQDELTDLQEELDDLHDQAYDMDNAE